MDKESMVSMSLGSEKDIESKASVSLSSEDEKMVYKGCKPTTAIISQLV